LRGVADTSWLYAFFVASDIHHSKAVQQSTKVETVHVPPAIVVETLFAMPGVLQLLLAPVNLLMGAADWFIRLWI